jgi:uncharacterized short protein YbdD (DUF466 family)
MKGRLAGQMIQLRSRLIETVGQVRRAYLQIFGIPDYERYLTHVAAHHPGEAPLSRRDFSARAIERKYSRAGPKCC